MDTPNPAAGPDIAAQPAQDALPPRPKVPQDVISFVDKWWKDTTNVPDHDAAVRAARECQKTLFPAWFDRTDPFRGYKQKELRTRQDDRRVRLNLAYKNILQAVALVVPDDHSFKWDAVPQVGAEQGIADPATTQLAATLMPIVRRYCDEANWQEVVQGWVQDAHQYRIAVMKVVFDRDFVKDSVKIHTESKDQQQMIERLRVLVEDYGRKRFNDQDARFKEMMDLKDTLQIEGDIMRLWTGLRAELVPIDCIRFDPAIRGYEQIYQAAWISHDVRMSCDEIREHFPFKMKEDGTWEGVHPDDLQSAFQNEDRRNGIVYGGSQYGSEREKGKGPTPQADSMYEQNRMTVREVWCRKLGRVITIIEGINYPAASWTPKNGPAQWYPFRFLRLNRVTGQVYGFSDVELQMEIQDRINRKRSDEEKARWLSLPRGYYNTQGIDNNEVNKMREHMPGEWKGINLGGAKSLKEVMEFQQFAFDINAFSTAKDETDMRMMSSLPQQMMGVTGEADYSSEVKAAMQGAAIASGARGTICRRALEGAYDMVAEILLQELTSEEALAEAGPAGFWPHVYSDSEGHRLWQEIQAQAKTEVEQQIQMMQAQQQAQQLQAVQMGMPPTDVVPPPPQTLIDQAIAEKTKEKCLQTFGWEEPVTRETLFRRLKCRVTVAMNTAADRQERVAATQSIFAALQMGSQAAASISTATAPAGQVCVFNPKPMLELVKTLFNGDEEIKTMFEMVPIMPMAPTEGKVDDSAGLPPEVAGKTQQEVVGANNAPTQSANTAVQPVGEVGAGA